MWVQLYTCCFLCCILCKLDCLEAWLSLLAGVAALLEDASSAFTLEVAKKYILIYFSSNNIWTPRNIYVYFRCNICIRLWSCFSMFWAEQFNTIKNKSKFCHNNSQHFYLLLNKVIITKLLKIKQCICRIPIIHSLPNLVFIFFVKTNIIICLFTFVSMSLRWVCFGSCHCNVTNIYCQLRTHTTLLDTYIY